MAKMTIYISDSLRREMDKSDKVRETNWSALASGAFLNRLAEIAAEKAARKEQDMSDVINRLKASKAKSQNRERTAGIAAGREWAKNHAEAEELQRLEDQRDHNNDWYFGEGTSSYTDADYFVMIVRNLEPENFHDSDSSDFWENHAEEGQSANSDFVHGFALGAMEVWSDAKKHI